MLKKLICVLVCLLVSLGAAAADMVVVIENPVLRTRDAIAARLIAKYTPEQLIKLDPQIIEQEITPEERTIFATQHWSFDVNVPVVVSVIRDTNQPAVPFWLPESGFVKTDLLVRNQKSRYEVWQKKFDAGHVGLGINGFDKHRPHYLVTVGPQKAGDKVEVSNSFPPNQETIPMRKGAFTYYDWSDLLLTVVPKELEGQLLLPTIRGRARDAHLLQAFRMSTNPSSEMPDNILLTWCEDPKTTQAIQWRTNPAVAAGYVAYREKGAPEWLKADAKCAEAPDFLVVNDPRVNHFTAVLRGLKPGTSYEYTVGNEKRSVPSVFTTAPEKPEKFTFLFLSDTHNSPLTTQHLAGARKKYPGTAFWVISGDLVGTGQHRDDWDSLFGECADISDEWPLMPTVGNHDGIDGLGNGLYREMLELPTNGPKEVSPENTYSFSYGNAQFFMIDVNSPAAPQARWLEEQLRMSNAKWKFAVLHFPPYGPRDIEPELVEKLAPLFDEYHVDFVLSGHVHQYMRTSPLKNGEPAEDGTIYLISVAVKGDSGLMAKPPYAEVLDTAGRSEYMAITVDGDTVEVRAEDVRGEMFDTVTVKK
jgi:predicted phosphodiesterase